MTINNKNRRSTRRSFGRRALAFGVAMFAMVTLTAVGFAAWLISSNATESANGGIVTEDVSVKSIRVTIENKDSNGYLLASDGSSLQIVFAPKKDATAGDILQFNATGENKDDKPENLTFHANGTIENWDKVGELTFTVRVPDSVITAAGLTKDSNGWHYDSTKAYVELPTYAMDKDGNAIPKVVGGKLIADASDKGVEVFVGEVKEKYAVTSAISFENISDLDKDSLSQTVDVATIAIEKPESGLTATFSATGLGFKWGIRYDNKNPAEIANVNKSDWGSLTSVVGIVQNQSYTANQLFLELLRMNSVINSQELEDLYGDAKIKVGETETSLTAAISALDEGKGIDDFVKEAETSTVSAYLTALQTALNTAIDGKAVTYQLVINAIVK